MKMKAFTNYLIILILSVSVVNGQPFHKEKLDSLLHYLETHNKAMGSISLARNGQVQYTRAIGYSYVTDNEKIPANEMTVYRIGSISKMFTATLILQLVEEGKLSLTTTLDAYYPTIPNASRVTIENMLNHRSGIHSFTNDPSYLLWMTNPKTHEEIVKIISDSKSEFEPGSKADYSNSNFVLLGYIIEIVCGKPYPEVLKERITSRIGLNRTSYGGKTDVNNNESFSYSYLTRWEQKPETDMSIPHGAGSIVSTPTELAQFIHALFMNKLLTPQSLEKMTAITDGLGLGIQQFPFNNRKAYGHGGSIDGFNSMLAFFPDDSVAIAYCSNGTGYSINEILIGALTIYYDMPYTFPVFSTIALTTEDLDKYLGNYSSTQIPLKIAISKNNTTLMAQATGQPAFPLEPSATDMFTFDPAGVVIEFNPARKELTIKQGGMSFLYTKDN